MKRLLPSLPLSVAVFVLWLLLVADFGIGQMLLALVLAVALPLAASLLGPEPARFGRARVALRLLPVVLWDMVLSNIEVARRILGPEKALKPAFLWLPLDITSIHGITALASVITLANQPRAALVDGWIKGGACTKPSHRPTECSSYRES